ncbi:MAG: DNA-binding protein [Candidatus Hodarchaeales archaeon]
MSEDELESLRKKRAAEMQKQLEQQRQQEEAVKEIEARKNAILMSILTEDARQRLSNIKLAKPDIASSLENQLITLAQSRRLTQKIDDYQLRQLLKQIVPKSRDRNIKVVRK